MNNTKKLVYGMFSLGILGATFVGGMIVGAQMNERVWLEHSGVAQKSNLELVGVSEESTYNYTGMDVWREMNALRATKGLNEIQLSDLACANIGARWQEMYDNFIKTGSPTHDGILEFRKKQEELGVWPIGYGPAELGHFGATTAKGVVESLYNSPSHSLELLRVENKYGCAHSQEGVTVILLHNQK